MNSEVYLFVASLVVWGGLAWYMLVLSKRQKELRDEIRILKNRARVQE